ncbi:hypothetical protein [Lentzea sp. NPDC092896]|uniref:hypothetical protein n=1 Tax=Lentzea sp. NPDC092896 TaxID=3364127 RepID=UPI00380D73DE
MRDGGRLVALAGFTATAALLVLTFAALVTNALLPLGWQGPEYLVAFFCIALGSAIAGPVVKRAAPVPWRPAGSGMLLAGLAGLGLLVALVALIYWGFPD